MLDEMKLHLITNFSCCAAWQIYFRTCVLCLVATKVRSGHFASLKIFLSFLFFAMSREFCFILFQVNISLVESVRSSQTVEEELCKKSLYFFSSSLSMRRRKPAFHANTHTHTWDKTGSWATLFSANWDILRSLRAAAAAGQEEVDGKLHELTNFPSHTLCVTRSPGLDELICIYAGGWRQPMSLNGSGNVI